MLTVEDYMILSSRKWLLPLKHKPTFEISTVFTYVAYKCFLIYRRNVILDVEIAGGKNNMMLINKNSLYLYVCVHNHVHLPG